MSAECQRTAVYDDLYKIPDNMIGQKKRKCPSMPSSAFRICGWLILWKKRWRFSDLMPEAGGWCRGTAKTITSVRNRFRR